MLNKNEKTCQGQTLTKFGFIPRQKMFYNIKSQVAPAIYGIGAVAMAGVFMATPTVPPLVTNQVLRPVINMFSSFLKHWVNKVAFICGKPLQTELDGVEHLSSAHL